MQTELAAQAQRIERLQQEVAEVNALRDEVAELRSRLDASQAVEEAAYVPWLEAATGPTCDSCAGGVGCSGGCTGSTGSGGDNAGLPSCLDGSTLVGAYKYNFGGGYVSLASRDGDFSFNIQNQMTADGTF